MVSATKIEGLLFCYNPHSARSHALSCTPCASFFALEGHEKKISTKIIGCLLCSRGKETNFSMHHGLVQNASLQWRDGVKKKYFANIDRKPAAGRKVSCWLVGWQRILVTWRATAEILNCGCELRVPAVAREKMTSQRL